MPYTIDARIEEILAPNDIIDVNALEKLAAAWIGAYGILYGTLESKKIASDKEIQASL